MYYYHSKIVIWVITRIISLTTILPLLFLMTLIIFSRVLYGGCKDIGALKGGLMERWNPSCAAESVHTVQTYTLLPTI